MSERSHFNEQGRARMTDITAKQETIRTAIARSSITVNANVYRQITESSNQKGDVFAVAQVAGIMAAKQTASLIPMCHPITILSANLEFQWDIDSSLDHYVILIRSSVKTKGSTGVEMEAMTAASVAALTIYDMCKAAGKEMVIGPTMLISKTGGKSGDFKRNE